MSLARKLARREARKVSPLVTCYVVGCDCRAETRAVLMVTPSRVEPRVPVPVNFCLCAKHVPNAPTLDELLAIDKGLWSELVAGLAPSGRVPMRELTRLEWEPCGPVHPDVITHGAANIRAALGAPPADEEPHKPTPMH